MNITVGIIWPFFNCMNLGLRTSDSGWWGKCKNYNSSSLLAKTHRRGLSRINHRPPCRNFWQWCTVLYTAQLYSHRAVHYRPEFMSSGVSLCVIVCFCVCMCLCVCVCVCVCVWASLNLSYLFQTRRFSFMCKSVRSSVHSVQCTHKWTVVTSVSLYVCLCV